MPDLIRNQKEDSDLGNRATDLMKTREIQNTDNPVWKSWFRFGNIPPLEIVHIFEIQHFSKILLNPGDTLINFSKLSLEALWQSCLSSKAHEKSREALHLAFSVEKALHFIWEIQQKFHPCFLDFLLI